MIKRISLVRRRQGMSLEEFERHWVGPHAELGLRLPQLRGYKLNVIRECETETEWDGVGEVWFDTVEAARAAFNDPSLRELLAVDRPKFLDERREIFFATEHVILRPA